MSYHQSPLQYCTLSLPAIKNSNIAVVWIYLFVVTLFFILFYIIQE